MWIVWAAMRVIERADVVLALGCRLGPFGTLPQHGMDYWPKNAKIIQVDADHKMLGLVKKISVGICGDAGAEGLSGCSERPGWPQRIDLALLGRSLASDVHAPGIDVIADELRPRHVVLTHVEPGAAPRYRAVAARLAGRIADLTVLEHPLDRFTFRAGDGRAR